jgi:ABC-type lipopolysaccharide export system ATPase subunit
MENILEVDSINKSFLEKKILSDVYLKCKTGDIIGVFGRNGSGKSTLLKIIYGTLNAENKFIRLNNKVLTQAYKLEYGISFLPQHNFIPNNFSVKKVVNLIIRQNKHDEFYKDKIINKIKTSKIGSLSGGELKYLQIKLTLFGDAKFCLLDEPFSGVSPKLAELINNQIIEQSKNKGIIIADHNYLYLLEIASKIYLLNEGVGKFLKNKEELIKFGYLKNGMLKE